MQIVSVNLSPRTGTVKQPVPEALRGTLVGPLAAVGAGAGGPSTESSAADPPPAPAASICTSFAAARIRGLA